MITAQYIGIVFFTGIVTGLSVLKTQKVLFLYKKPALFSLFFLIRVVILSKIFYIMLKSNQIHPIILVTVFLLGYWLIILKYKE